jgi:tellurite resistance-related uncharacterized protein
MARHYSSKSFFRQMPNALLARYFTERGLFGDLSAVGGRIRSGLALCVSQPARLRGHSSVT